MKDKKQAIEEACLSCLGEGQNPNEIKIAEIARRAGVGKGTVYEYFSSKEELFAESVLSFIAASVGDIRRAGEAGSFRERFDAVLKALSGCLEHNRPLFYTIFFHSQFCASGSEASGRMRSRQSELQREMVSVLHNLARVGAEEGLFPPPGEQDTLFAFSCIAGALSFAECCPGEQFGEELFSVCYEKFLKLMR